MESRTDAQRLASKDRKKFAEEARRFVKEHDDGERPDADPEVVRLARIIAAYVPPGREGELAYAGAWMMFVPDPLGIAVSTEDAEEFSRLTAKEQSGEATPEQRERLEELVEWCTGASTRYNEAVEDAMAKLVRISAGYD